MTILLLVLNLLLLLLILLPFIINWNSWTWYTTFAAIDVRVIIIKRNGFFADVLSCLVNINKRIIITIGISTTVIIGTEIINSTVAKQGFQCSYSSSSEPLLLLLIPPSLVSTCISTRRIVPSPHDISFFVC